MKENHLGKIFSRSIVYKVEPVNRAKPETKEGETMKKRAICALSAALAFCSAAAGAESDRETLYFKADSHEMIVTAEEITETNTTKPLMYSRDDGRQTDAGD